MTELPFKQVVYMGNDPQLKYLPEYRVGDVVLTPDRLCDVCHKPLCERGQGWRRIVWNGARAGHSECLYPPEPAERTEEPAAPQVACAVCGQPITDGYVQARAYDGAGNYADAGYAHPGCDLESLFEGGSAERTT